MPSEPSYTVVGWRPDRVAGDVAGYQYRDSPLMLLDWLDRYREPNGGYPRRILALFEGLHRPLAVFGPMLPIDFEASSARAAVMMTVVGFWRSSGHCLVEHVVAGDGYEAMALVQAMTAEADELQLVCALAGRLVPLYRIDQRPRGGWLVNQDGLITQMLRRGS